jgi:Spy/CpxP family protein refolding chaperone
VVDYKINQGVLQKGEIMLQKSLGVAVVAIMISAIFLVSGCRHGTIHKTSEKRMDWMLKRFSRDLKLTETQKEQFDRFKTELRIKARELRVGYVNTIDELGIQLRSDEFDRQHLQDVIAKNSARREELISLFLTRLAEFHSTLTPEQRTTLNKKLDKMKRWGKRYCRFSR